MACLVLNLRWRGFVIVLEDFGTTLRRKMSQNESCMMNILIIKCNEHSKYLHGVGGGN